MDWQLVIIMFVTLIISLTVHEAAHGLFAHLGGDSTAYEAGLVTLNPLPHMQREPVGMVVLPLVMLYISNGSMCFGGASAPIDPYWAAKNPKKSALMSAAGPLANVLLAAIAFAVLYYIGKPEGDSEVAVRNIARTFLLLNLLLAIFNLIPHPPFDGSGVISGLFPTTQRVYDSFRRLPYSSILALLVAWALLPHLFFPAYAAVGDWLPYPLSYK
jgi:Zn-dependent protease